MKEELRITAEREGNLVKIKVKGLCTDDLVYAVISDLLRAVKEGGRINED